MIFAHEKKRPRAFTTWRGVFWKTMSGLLVPRNDTKITTKTHASHTPSTDESTDETNSWGSLHRPGQAAPMSEGTPASGPAPAAQRVLQRGLLPRNDRPSFAPERSVGPSGWQSYSAATKLRVIEYTRLRCPDGGVVGNRGAAAGLEQGLCPKRIRDWALNMLGHIP